jgi:hypothetical protein
MTVTDWANVARCAEQRMDALWEQACRSNYRTAEENLCARWRENDTYMASQAMARYIWRLQ